MIINLENQRIVLTGASRGVGKAIALLLAKEKVKIVITGRHYDSLIKVKEEVEKFGSEAYPIVIDASDVNNAKYLVDETIKKLGGIDVLINNAATAIAKPFKLSTSEEWDLLMTVNAKFPFFLIQEALPYLEKSVSPAIINISSVSGRMSYENQALYAASKHALMGFTKALAREVQRSNIRVHTICPGAIATDMADVMRPDLDKENLIKPEEIAEIVLFLLKFKGNSMIDNIDVRRSNGTPFV